MRDAVSVDGRRTPTVVYLAGSGRSGSTLVERAIGATQGFVNIGEALDLYRQALVDNELCGCGAHLRECHLWGSLVEHVDVLGDPEQVDTMMTLQRRLVRQRQLPRMLVPPLRTGAFGAGLQQYAAGYARIYQAVAQATGAQYVVDASKWPVQALALASAGLDIRVLQVVRDPRGVAYSLSKTDVLRPHAAAGETMSSRPPLSAAARWTLTQAQVDGLRLSGLPTALLRYESFVADPAQSVRAALAHVGIGVDMAALGHLRPGHADLPVSHGIAGNPSRFRVGGLDLRVDQGWRDSLSGVQQAAVLTLAAPHLPRLRRAARQPMLAVLAAVATAGTASGGQS